MTGLLLKEIKVHRGCFVCLSLTYDGKTGLATMDVPKSHSMGIYSVAFIPDSSHFITDKTVKLWNAETLVCEQTLSMSSDPQINDSQVKKCLNPSHLCW
jgi:WD40 repeat protein